MTGVGGVVARGAAASVGGIVGAGRVVGALGAVVGSGQVIGDQTAVLFPPAAVLCGSAVADRG